VFVVQPTCAPVNDHVIELVAFADACRRAGAPASRPWFRTSVTRAPTSAANIAIRSWPRQRGILQGAGIDHVITVDPHSAQLEACFRIPVDVASAVPTLAHRCAAGCRTRPSSSRLTSGPYASRRAMEILSVRRVLHKRRATARDRRHACRRRSRNRPALITDDMISTGGTIRRSIDALLDAGAKDEIIVAATHGLLPGARNAGCGRGARSGRHRHDSARNGWEKPRVVSIAPVRVRDPPRRSVLVTDVPAAPRPVMHNAVVEWARPEQERTPDASKGGS
jgi:ribose-phosphate pyrophosphokinase